MKQKGSVPFPLEVLYDGSCSICTAAMQFYLKRVPDHRLHFIDIAHPAFDPSLYDRTSEELKNKIHVRDCTGRFYTDVEGFWAIWQAFPKNSIHHLMGVAITLPGVNRLARSGYGLFSRHRHLFSKRRDTCDTGECRRS